MKIILSTSSEEGTRRGVCILPIPVEAILGVVATSLMRKVGLPPGLVPIGLCSMHTPLPVPSSLEVDKMVYTLRPHRFCLVWT